MSFAQVYKIAVIGGGPAGLAFCLQLFEKVSDERFLNRRLPNIEVWLLEKSNQIGPGLAYQGSAYGDTHLLNIPKDEMSPYMDRYGEFSRWLETNKKSHSE